MCHAVGMKIRVAGARVSVTDDVARNADTLRDSIEWAARERVRVLLTPEGSLSGYTHDFDRRAVERELEAIVRRAREVSVGLALGTCFVEEDGRCYNQVRMYAPDGTYLGFHAKILRCGSMSDPPRGEIEHFAAAPLRTFTIDGVRCGALICNDLWANPACTPADDPHLTHRLSGLGARIVFHAVNGGRDDSEFSRVTVRWFHESNLRLRARADGLFIVTCDNAFPTHLPCSAPSGVVDPDGSWLLQVPPQGDQRFAVDIALAPSASPPEAEAAVEHPRPV
jgi:predicted amidohydrolase